MTDPRILVEEGIGASHAVAADRFGTMEVAGVELCEAIHAQQTKTGANLALQQLKHSGDAGCAARRDPETVQPAQPDRGRAERDRLHDVGATQESAVDQDLGPPRDRRHHLRHHVDAPAAVVELASAVVGDVDDVDAHIACERRVLAGRDALEHQRDIEAVLHPLHVVPREALLVVLAARPAPPGGDEALCDVAFAA